MSFIFSDLLRPYGLAVRTPPFHGGSPGSIPGRVAIISKNSSPDLHATTLPLNMAADGLARQTFPVLAAHRGGLRSSHRRPRFRARAFVQARFPRRHALARTHLVSAAARRDPLPLARRQPHPPPRRQTRHP